MRVLLDAGWLALRALASSPGRALTLVAALGVALGLPALTWRAGGLAERALLDRAGATPVVLGAPGDTFDLVFAALHFRPGGAAPLPWSAVASLAAPGLRLAPVHVVHQADTTPVVGTTPEYYTARGLRAAEGRLPAVLGEAVAGAAAARGRGLQPGSALRTEPGALHDLAGEAPLTLHIVGVLDRTGTADDRALFTDIKTAWALDGALHGHDPIDRAEALPGDPEGPLRASGAVQPHDTDAASLAGYHLHGDPDAQPITAILAFPADARSHDLLLDRAATLPELRAIRPPAVVADLLSVGHRLRNGLLLFLGLVGGATVALVALALELSRRLRAREAAVLRRLGAHPALVPLMHATEGLALLAAGALLAAALVLAADSALTQALLP